jgi:hypothetical protein
MDTSLPAADLTASLLRSTPQALQEPPAPEQSPFFDKGEATAGHFRPDHPTAAPIVAGTGSAVAREVRLWLRVVPPLRWRLKLAAAVLGQTCQRFLVDALDAALAEGSAVDDPGAAKLPRDGGEPRVKLAFWVDHGRRSALRFVVAEHDETQQAFLHGALEGHLRRFAPSGLLLPADGGAGAEIIAFPPPSGMEKSTPQATAANLVVTRNAG